MNESTLHQSLNQLARRVPALRPHLAKLMTRRAFRIPQNPKLRGAFQQVLLRACKMIDKQMVTDPPSQDFWEVFPIILRKVLIQTAVYSFTDLAYALMDAGARAESNVRSRTPHPGGPDSGLYPQTDDEISESPY